MASHGVPRIRDGEPRSRPNETEEIKKYKTLVDDVTKKIHSQEYTLETLQLTSQLLVRNPEYYTIWNHRRRILEHLFHQLPNPEATHRGTDTPTPPHEESKHTTILALITNDLAFIYPKLLTKFPKCYWIWNYRLWLLQRATALLPPPSAHSLWTAELSLDSKMLTRDSRNFHGWGYRRTIVAALSRSPLPPPPTTDSPSSTPPTPLSEFAYTTTHIRLNLSNFSAWHARSTLLPQLLASTPSSTPATRRARLDAELDMVQEALYTDPRDQSLWFYHQALCANFDVAVRAPADVDAEASGGEAPWRRERLIAPELSPGEKAAYVGREMAAVKEMRDGAEDCKWIYQRLVELGVMYRRVAGQWPEGWEGEWRGWMGELRRLDPLRGGRWGDWERGLEGVVKSL